MYGNIIGDCELDGVRNEHEVESSLVVSGFCRP